MTMSGALAREWLKWLSLWQDKLLYFVSFPFSMYKIKQIPEDFIVNEINNLTIDDGGKYSYFLLKKKNLSFLFVSGFPLVLYLFFTFFNLVDFIKILGIGGVVSGGLTGILILLMNLKAKKEGTRKPEFSISINWLIIGILSLIFLAGIFVELF